MPERRYLGIDAGGSTTVCMVGDGTATLGRGVAAGANPTLVGVDGFRAAIVAATTAALRDLQPAPIAVAWLGVAGSERPGMRAELRAVAAEALGAEDVEISHDARLLLAAADLDHGIGLVAGTGSSAFGRTEDGRELSLGGWGYLLGDEGSAHDIGRAALRAVAQAADGRGPATRLTEDITRALGVSVGEELRERCYPAVSVSEVAGLAAVVLDLASEDGVAASILRAAAADLALAVAVCDERMQEPHSSPRVIVAAGGLLRPRSPLLAFLEAALQARDASYQVSPLLAEPASGALALARDGPTTDEQPARHRSPASSRS
jgi:N-acetylglucosamine kinase-like BadF-type ATPase